MFRASVVAGMLMLLVPLASAGGTRTGGRVIRAPGPIATIAMDGPRLAYDGFSPAVGCSKVFVLNVVTGKKQPVSRCLSDIGSRFVAIAGRRVAWIDDACTPGGCDETLAAASLSRGPRVLSTASSDDGDWIANVVGSGGVLAVNAGPPPGLAVIGKKLKWIASGQSSRNAQAADSGRIAVLRSYGTVGIFKAAGRLLVHLRPGPVSRDESFYGDAVALKGEDLLVLTTRRRLEVYDSYSGARLHSWPVHKNATNLAAAPGLAAYAEYPAGAETCCSPYRVHVVRLATGKDVVLGRGKWFTNQRDVALGPAGLVYLKDRRTLVFIPLSRVWAAVS